MTLFDIAPLNDLFVDRQCSGDEFDADRRMRASLQLGELCACDSIYLYDDFEDSHANASCN